MSSETWLIQFKLFQHHVINTGQKVEIIMIFFYGFERSVLCSPRLILFDYILENTEKYSKKNTVILRNINTIYYNCFLFEYNVL